SRSRLPTIGLKLYVRPGERLVRIPRPSYPARLVASIYASGSVFPRFCGELISLYIRFARYTTGLEGSALPLHGLAVGWQEWHGWRKRDVRSTWYLPTLSTTGTTRSSTPGTTPGTCRN